MIKIARYFYLSLACMTSPLLSLPENMTLKEGCAVSHLENPNSLVIHTQGKTILEYTSFDISPHERVEFVQQNASSHVLNRVQGGNPSHILGALHSNGKIFLINENGIYFGKNAIVSASSIFASTLNISNEDFLQGRFSFSLDQNRAESKLRNEGHLIATEGQIVLLAPIVQNAGVLQASAGQVVIASAEHVTLDFAGDRLISFAVEGEIKEALIENLGTIAAPQGEIFLRLPIARRAIKATLNTEGIEAGAVFVEQEGKIILAPISALQTSALSLQASSIDIEGTIKLIRSQKEGGTLSVDANFIAVKEANIYASGFALGGILTIGSPLTTSVLVDAHSLMQVEGGTQGMGGQVCIQSGGSLSFHGTIEASGGLKGGFVETSATGFLDVQNAYVHTSSLEGSFGTWLIDPSILYISPAGGGIPPDCLSGGVVDVTTLQTQDSTVLLCANRIIQEAPIFMENPGVGLIFSAPPGSSGSLLLQDAIVTKSGIISVENLDIELTGPLLLSTVGDGSSGADILLGNIDSSSSPHDLTLLSGNGHIVARNIGSSFPLNNVLIGQASSAFVQDISSQTGSIVLKAPIILSKPLTTFSMLSSDLSAHVQIQSVEGSADFAESLMISSQLQNAVAVLSTGVVHPLDVFTIGPSREVVLGPIEATTFLLTESIGLTTLQSDISCSEAIYIQGGTLLIKGILAAPSIDLAAHGPILSGSKNQNILFDTHLVLDAQGAAIGTASTPVSVASTSSGASIVLGAKILASLQGPGHDTKQITLNPANSPCLVLFNQHVIADCVASQKGLLDLIAKSSFVVGYQTAQHLGIGKNPLLKLGPYFLSSYYTDDFPQRIDNPGCHLHCPCQGQPRNSAAAQTADARSL